ncbi:MAG: PAS domain-containing protein [Haliea sp.]|nr:MAG: PAS domain-containing protein [Haliea sp.]
MAGPVSIAPWAELINPLQEDSAFIRLWRGFATARVAIAMVLLGLLLALYMLGPPTAVSHWLVGICAAYLAAALAVRFMTRPTPPGQVFDPQWVSTIGIDLLAFATLQFLQAGGINYTPLFAVPVLMASVLGSALLAFGTAAAVTILLLADAWLQSIQLGPEVASRFLQAGLTGTGYFALAFLANQLAVRLAGEERAARRSQRAARIQAQVNELVIETLTDGVLVVDLLEDVHAANPAARQLLGCGQASLTGQSRPFALSSQEAWRPLVELAEQTFRRREGQHGEVAIQERGAPPRRVSVRTRLTAPHDDQADSLCVIFLEDLREMEARLRTEKLAAMGRMSAAVAHEIRNPLAAIAQANALLEEDLIDPAHRQLSGLVRQNAQRLGQIVDEILDISRVQQQGVSSAATVRALDTAVAATCGDWALQTRSSARMQLALGAGAIRVAFAPDHLRRVLVNLLDNALRYAGTQPDSIRVHTSRVGSQTVLSVWSDGSALEQTVQRHLFEPFFSSESRSSGLGLYICRELCEQHGALIGYRRCPAPAGAPRDGNEFFVSFRPAAAAASEAARFDTIA